MNSKQKGNRYEAIAVSYLCGRGYQILAQQYRCLYGEIDLIAQDGSIIVFVEVKGRQSTRYGFAQEAIDHKKQQRIYRTAQHFLWSQGKPQVLCRFDVIAIQEPSLGHHHIQHIVGAFDGWDL